MTIYVIMIIYVMLVVNSRKRTWKNANELTISGGMNMLENININNGSSIFMSEMGIDGFKQFVAMEYYDSKKKSDS